MTNVSWPTVALSTVLSAGVAGLVALAADYFARPGLEARKERILECYRAQRGFETQLRNIQVAASAMCSSPEAGALSSEEAALFEQEIGKQREEVLNATRAMGTYLSDFALDLPKRAVGPAARYVGRARGVAISSKSDPDAGAELLTITGPLLDYFHVRGWRRILRRQHLRRARAILGIAG